MKKCLGTIFANLLKVWGAAWIGFLVSFLPMYIMRFNSASYRAENLVSGISGGLGTIVALFLFFKWEGRKREFRIASPKEIALYSVVPTILWALIGSLFAPNPFLVLTNAFLFCDAITGIEKVADYAFFQPFPYALLFAVFYSAAIFGGYMYGRKFSDL